MQHDAWVVLGGISLGLALGLLFKRRKSTPTSSSSAASSSSTANTATTTATVTTTAPARPKRSSSAVFKAAEKEGYTLADVVAGHSISQLKKESAKNDPVALLSTEGYFLKPVQQDVRGDREINFYKTTLETSKVDIPVYNGLEVINANTYLRLNNVERSFAYPCTIDIKLGRQTYGPGATEAKKKRARKKWKYMSTTATGVCGMKVYYPHERYYLRLGKKYGRALKGNTGMIHALTTFLFNGRSLRIDVIDRLVVQLLRRKVWLKDVCRHVCYSMSILLVYEGGGVGVEEEGGGGGGGNGRNKGGGDAAKEKVVFVDFAHAYLKDGSDGSSGLDHRNQSQDCLAGIDHVVASLRKIQSMYLSEEEEEEE